MLNKRDVLGRLEQWSLSFPSFAFEELGAAFPGSSFWAFSPVGYSNSVQTLTLGCWDVGMVEWCRGLQRQDYSVCAFSCTQPSYLRDALSHGSIL